MMNYNMMNGSFGGIMMFFSWTTYILVTILLVLAVFCRRLDDMPVGAASSLGKI